MQTQRTTPQTHTPPASRFGQVTDLLRPSLRVVHFSDWHGRQMSLPAADLYVCTGDMLPNFSSDRAREVARQTAWRDQPGNRLRAHLGAPNAPVVCVRGNHDFVDLAPLFHGGPVHELIHNEVVVVHGIQITGHRGVPWINGTWSDEVPRADLVDRVHAMPPADLYLTHYPPLGVLDIGLGLADVTRVLDQHTGSPSGDLPGATHCFGHIHERGGHVEAIGNVAYSNAATTFNVLRVFRSR